MEKHGRTRQATDDCLIRRMRFACWITKATDIHSEYAILFAFPWLQWLHVAPYCYCMFHCLSFFLSFFTSFFFLSFIHRMCLSFFHSFFVSLFVSFFISLFISFFLSFFLSFVP